MYDGYGAKLGDTDAYTGNPEPPTRDAMGFQGQFGAYTDNETGLVLMGHRYYDAGTGRFLTRDPMGYGGGINLYGFTGNNPVNEMDPDGLRPGHHGFRVQPQTITAIPGAVLITHTAINVDDDGVDSHHRGFGHLPFHQDSLPGRYNRLGIDPSDVPYLVYGVPRYINNHGVKPGDFGVVIYRNKTAGGPAIDAGHSLLGEASIDTHNLLGNNPGKRDLIAIDQNKGAIGIIFPGSGANFHGPYTQANIEAYAAQVYNTWAASHQSLVVQHKLPRTFH